MIEEEANKEEKIEKEKKVIGASEIQQNEVKQDENAAKTDDAQDKKTEELKADDEIDDSEKKTEEITTSEKKIKIKEAQAEADEKGQIKDSTEKAAEKNPEAQEVQIKKGGKVKTQTQERKRSERRRIDRRISRPGIRRDEYRNRSYDVLPARDQNLSEIISTGNIDLLNRTAEDYGKTWGDRPPWVKNRFSTSQIRPVLKKLLLLKKSEFNEDAVNEFKLLKPFVAYIARRYHDDDLYEFARLIRFGIDEVGDDFGKFKNFYTFIEALMCYFRANGGK